MKDKDFQQLYIIYAEHDRVWSLCPYHKDRVRPNLSISILDKYYGNFTCWACGRKGRLTKWQMGKLNLSSCVVHKNNSKSLLTRWKLFTESCCDNLKKFPLLKLGLAKELNISIKSLDKWLVGFDGTSFTIPMFREDLTEYNLDKGFCGVQRRFPDGTKRCISGSRLGLMYPYSYIGDYYIFICEGFSDAISVWDLGLQSIARPHCRHTDGIEELFDYVLEEVEEVIIIPDNDTVGHEGAEKLQSILLGADYNCEIHSFSGAKDIRKLIQLKGKDYVRQDLGKYI